MTTDQLRARFLNFFQTKGHVVVESDSLVPRHDPTLLFTGAGMNQFKDQFMGRNIEFKRAATCQKCLRTADLDKVGKTSGHHTFFEMLGNFSFGDYFKKEAIIWAWEFLTEETRIPKERFWVSLYIEDDEAYGIWKDEVGIAPDRIVRLGDKENFWPSEVKKNGPNGPCGPCSEIFYDWGSGTGCGRKGCDPSCDCGRFVEIWNLVFTQFDRREGGVLEPLPTKNIDTGMGLERLAAVMQRKETNFGIDTFSYIIKTIAKETDCRYGKDRVIDSHVNAIADHIRAAIFAISDGARPSNEGRGFVIRKILRKASQRARAIGVREPFMYRIIPSVAKVMKPPYPELWQRREDIARVVFREEVNLKDILDMVLPRVEEDFVRLKEEGKAEVPGDMIFRYYDEKGVPFDLIEEKAAEISLRLDTASFKNLLEKQKARSRDNSKVAGSIFFEKLSDVNLKTKFYCDKAEASAKVSGILKEDNGRTERVDSAAVGDMVHIALDATPFYGEAGGQAGDKGEITSARAKVVITDAKKYEDTIDHIGRVKEGVLSVGDKVEAKIDIARRERIKMNHTATHLLHSALRKVLGEYAQQYGSLVEEDRLRFDFTHITKLQERERERIEEIVNDYIAKDMRVATAVMSLDGAKRTGAMALFGEKYKDEVLVRSIGNISKELCGGTHVESTADIRAFKILSETSIASGVRRIEAITGDAVYKWLKEDIINTISEYKSFLKMMKDYCAEAKEAINRIEDYLRPILFRVEQCAGKDIASMVRKDLDLWVKELKPEFARTIDDLSKEFKILKKRIKNSRISKLKSQAGDFINNAEMIGDIRVVSQDIPGADMEMLRLLLDTVKSGLKSGVILLGSSDSSRAILVCGITEDIVRKGLSADKLIKRIATIIGGSGGGRQDMAQAGGREPGRLKEALELGLKTIKEVTAK